MSLNILSVLKNNSQPILQQLTQYVQDLWIALSRWLPVYVYYIDFLGDQCIKEFSDPYVDYLDFLLQKVLNRHRVTPLFKPFLDQQ